MTLLSQTATDATAAAYGNLEGLEDSLTLRKASVILASGDDDARLTLVDFIDRLWVLHQQSAAVKAVARVPAA